MKGREFKDAIYDGLSKLLKALSNPYRLEIIEMLSQGEKSVEGIVQVTGLSFANASQHLQVMKNNNIVKSRKEGHYVFYSIVNDDFLALYQQIAKYALREVAELERIMNRQREDNKSTDAVSLSELESMIENDNVLLLDVRPSIEFEFGHITGAVSVPMNEMMDKLKLLSKDKEIVAYCRGPFCVLADEAVKILSEQGYNVRRLDEGYPEWKIKTMNGTKNNPFDPISKEYDQWFDDNKSTYHSELEAIKYFLPTQGRGVEIGVGTGRFASELGIGHGIEPSENMAMLAKQRGIEVIISKAEKLPYENESFDFAIMVTVDPFVEDIETVYSETSRILKTGGRLIVGSLHKDGDAAQKYMSMTDSEVYKSANFHTVTETIQQLTLAGFSDFKTCQTLFSINPTEVETPESGHDKGSFVAIEAIKPN